MKKLLLLPLLLLSFGCSHNYFNVPQETIAEKVQVLGVAPIMVDADSTIRFPQKDELLTLLGSLNRASEPSLVRKLKATGSFFTVAPLDNNPQQLFSTLLYRRELRNDAAIVYNKHFWKAQELGEFLKKNKLDALMLVVVSGVERKARISSPTLMDSVEADYNSLIMTAQIVAPDGSVLWEYPNFKRQLLSYYPLITLQYPDFSEAEANLSDKPQIKFKSLEGIQRALQQKRKDLLFRETQETEAYDRQFDEMTDLLAIDREKFTKPAAAPAPAAQPAKEEVKPAEAPAATEK